MSGEKDVAVERERKRRLHVEEIERDTSDRDERLRSKERYAEAPGRLVDAFATAAGSLISLEGAMTTQGRCELEIKEQDERIQYYTDNVMVASDSEAVNVKFAPPLQAPLFGAGLREEQLWYFDSKIPARDVPPCDVGVVFINSELDGVVCKFDCASIEEQAMNSADLCLRRANTWRGHMKVEPKVLCDTASGGLHRDKAQEWVESSGELFMNSYWSELNECVCVVSEPVLYPPMRSHSPCPDTTVFVSPLDDGEGVIVSVVRQVACVLRDKHNTVSKSRDGTLVFLRKTFSIARNLYYAILKFNRMVSRDVGKFRSIDNLRVNSVWGAECRPSGVSEKDLGVEIMMGLAYAARAYRLPCDAAVRIGFGPAIFAKIRQEQLFDFPTCNGIHSDTDTDNFSQACVTHDMSSFLRRCTMPQDVWKQFLKFQRGGVTDCRVHEVCQSHNVGAGGDPFGTSKCGMVPDAAVLQRCTLTYKRFQELDKGAVHSHTGICSYFDVAAKCLIVASGEHASHGATCQDRTVFVLDTGQIFAVCTAIVAREYTREVFVRAVFETARNLHFAITQFNRRAYARFECPQIDAVSMQMWRRDRPEGVLESETVVATIRGLFYAFEMLRKPRFITLVGDDSFAARDGEQLTDMYQKALDSKNLLSLPQIVTPPPSSRDESRSDEEDSDPKAP